MTEKRDNHIGALEGIISSLEALSPDDRERIIKTVLTYFGLDHQGLLLARGHPSITPAAPHGTMRAQGAPAFSDDRSMSPKEFMVFKQPTTDVEKATCLAFYLTHYRNLPHFKTSDITAVNTEAAQPRFSNTHYAAHNAARTGFLVPGPKGTRQISAIGERFVQALPDRDAAREVLMSSNRKKRAKKAKGRVSRAGDSE